MLDSIHLRSGYDALALSELGTKGTFSAPVPEGTAFINPEECSDFFQPIGSFANDFSAGAQDVANGGKALPAFGNICRQQFRNGSERRFRFQQQKEELLARHCLELRERHFRRFFGQAEPSQRRNAAFIDESPRRADIDQSPNGAFLKAAFIDLRFQLRNPLRNKFSVQWRFSRPPWPASRRVDSDRGLQRRPSIERAEHLFGESFLGLPPGIERPDDLFGNLFLRNDKRIILGRWPALLPDLLQQSFASTGMTGLASVNAS